MTEIGINDWAVVQLQLDDDRGSKNFIAQVVGVKKGRFVGNFLRPISTRDNNGFVYAYPQIKDTAPFEFSQVRRKLQIPVKYLRSMFLFTINEAAVKAM